MVRLARRCLIWLGGTHLNSRDWRKDGYSREAVRDSKAFEKLRSDQAVLARVEALRKSRNAWVRKQAEFTTSMLAKPLAHTGYPPPSG